MMQPGRGEGRRAASSPGAGEEGLRRDASAWPLAARSSWPLLAAATWAGRRRADEDAPRVRFPADVPPRNDILRRQPRARAHARRRHALRRCLPAGRATGRYPVIVSRTPYSTERFPTAYDAAVYFAQRGYVYVFQDIRGRHESEGRWEPFFDDEKDGYDTVEWAAKQPWSNGKVAMQGGSYLGQNQWRAAQADAAQPGHDLPDGRLDQPLSRLDHAQRRLAPVVQLRLGTGAPGVAHHAEPRAAHARAGCARSTTTRCSGTCP